MFLGPVTNVEVMREVAKLPTNKAPGICNLNSKVIKTTEPYISEILTYIYNLYSFTVPNVPDKLNIAKVIPIYKTKERCTPGNYTAQPAY